jgi:hypothetical protein
MLAAYRRWRRAGAVIALGCAASLTMAAALVLATAAAGQAARSPSWTLRKSFGGGAASAIAAPSPRAVWVTVIRYSDGNSVLVERWDGHSWHRVPTPAAMFTDGSAVVAASSAADAWVFTYVRPAVASPYAVAWHWNGHSWRQYRLATEDYVDAAAAFSPTDVWAYASGFSGGIPDLTSGYVVRFDGHRWHRIAAPVIPLSVSVRSSRDIWIAGPTAATANRQRPDFELARWTGSGWRTIPVPRLGVGTRVSVGSPEVLARGPGDVWLTLVASPSSGTGPSTVTALHYDGRTWSRFTGPVSLSPYTSNLAPDGRGGFWLALRRPGTSALVHFRSGGWGEPITLAGRGHYTVIAGLADSPGSIAPWAVGWTGSTTGHPDVRAVVYSYER